MRLYSLQLTRRAIVISSYPHVLIDSCFHILKKVFSSYYLMMMMTTIFHCNQRLVFLFNLLWQYFQFWRILFKHWSKHGHINKEDCRLWSISNPCFEFLWSRWLPSSSLGWVKKFMHFVCCHQFDHFNFRTCLDVKVNSKVRQAFDCSGE